ncbi:MAG: (p)ppGpp synthase/HD superfamily hydrolase [Alteromonadaceae bacterium]|jgi:(p)ppGpp synthase/HD superfamily hydrolase
MSCINFFGAEVTKYVKYVTDDKSLSLEARRAQQLKHLSSSEDAIKLIKLSDNCSNISCIPENWYPERISSYIEWSHSVATLCFSASIELSNEYMRRYKHTVSAQRCLSEHK